MKIASGLSDNNLLSKFYSRSLGITKRR